MHMANDNAGKSIQKWASMFLGGPYPEDGEHKKVGA